jgi:AcrR family transcriptional regulator
MSSGGQAEPGAGPGRRERRRRSTREEILALARELLLEVGPEYLTLREVARRAEYSPAALYTYFANREEIIASLMEESFRRLEAYIRQVPGDLPPDLRLVEFGMAYMDFARDNPTDLRCILLSASQELRAGVDRSVGLAAASLIGETFREGIDAGLFQSPPGMTPAEIAYGVWSLVHGMTALSGVDLTVAEGTVSAAPRRVLEAYVDCLRAPEAGEAPEGG